MNNRMKHNQLIAIIREVGGYWNEQGSELEDYAKLVAAEWCDNLVRAIDCFKQLKDQAKILAEQERRLNAGRYNQAQDPPRYKGKLTVCE